MHLVLKSETAAGLEEAHEYLTGAVKESALICQEDKTKSDRRAEYTVNLPDEECVELLNQLLVSFPDLDIYGSFINDVEGRDRSFWSTTTYQSSTDSSGNRVFEVSNSTNWA